MKKIFILLAVIVVIALQLFLASHIEPDLSHVGDAPHKIHHVFGIEIPFGGINEPTIFNTWIVMGFLVFSSLLMLRGKRDIIPGRCQAFMEMIVGGILQICEDTLGPKDGRKYLPYIGTIFLFILISNWMAVVPVHMFEEKPTKDLNTTLGMGVMVFFVSHISGIRAMGIKGYVSHYFEPFIPMGKFQCPNFLFAPLHIVGEVGKVVSHSFRLFGNIVGETIIIIVVSNLVHFAMLPIGLNVYFILGIGAIQAFVFTVLALIYLSIQIKHDDDDEHMIENLEEDLAHAKQEIAAAKEGVA